MTIPPIKETVGRPPVELLNTTADSPFANYGGVCVIGAEWGSGHDAATVIAGEYGELPRVPFELDMERWEVLAYDASANPVAIDCIIDVLTSDYTTNSFASIAGTEKPTLSGQSKNESTTLVGWNLDNGVDTMYRFVLVSFTGAPAKIVLGIRCFAP